MPDVTANGLRFNVHTLGDASGPPVVMAHGLLSGSAASWYFGLAPVVARDRFVFLYDQRGHGLSERPSAGYTLTELASDMDALTAGLGPCAVVGHSFGGVVALRHATAHPGRVTALVLVDCFVPAAGPDPDTMEEAGAAVGGRSGRSPRRRRPSAAQALLGSTSVLDDLRRDSVLDPSRLAALDVPVLCLVGTDSPFRGEVDALADLLPPAWRRRTEVPGGHALHLDAPDRLAHLVTEFLDEVVPATASSGQGAGRG